MNPIQNSASITRRHMLLMGGGMAAAPLASTNPPVSAGEAPYRPQSLIDVCDHGVRADGVTDNHEALQRVFTEVVPESGATVIFPPGVCRCDGRITCQGKPVTVLGHGQGATRILFTGSHPDDVGFLFVPERYPNTVQMRNLSLITNREEAGDALTIRYTEEDVMSMRVVERVFLENLNIAGDDIARHGFRNGVVLHHVNSPLLFNISVSGRQPAAGLANRTFTESCFKLIAGKVHESMPVQAGLMKCSGYNARCGVNLIGAHEGLVVTAGNFVECAVGISQNSGPEPGLLAESAPLPDGGIRPGIWVSDTHCNVFHAGIYLQGVVQGFLKDCLIYKAPDAGEEECIGIRLSNCSDIKAHHNLFVSQAPAGLFEGIRTENTTTRCQLFGNTFSLTDTSLHFGAATSHMHAWDNVVQSHKSGALIDHGSHNRIRELGSDTWRGTSPNP